jgi:hypothetical protein
MQSCRETASFGLGYTVEPTPTSPDKVRHYRNLSLDPNDEPDSTFSRVGLLLDFKSEESLIPCRIKNDGNFEIACAS